MADLGDEESKIDSGHVDVTRFPTYEDYLDSQITAHDRFYLEVRSRAPWRPTPPPWRSPAWPCAFCSRFPAG